MAPVVAVHEELIPLTGIEAAKQRAAFKAVDDHFLPTYRYIGIGSGSTVVYVVQAIAAKGRAITDRMIFVPTYGSAQTRPEQC
jgi:ribose 5-phosphate isomerase A